MSDNHLDLPIIDLSQLDNEATKADFYKHLRHLARDIGFFYLIGHGIEQAERDDLLNTAKKFFALPPDEKDKISMDNSPHFRGYSKVGKENTRKKTDFREQLDIGREEPANVYGEDDELFYRNLLGPNPWPEAVPELKEKSLAYIEKAHDVVVKLLRAFLVALEVPEDSLDNVYKHGRNLLKLSHYPANTEAGNEDKLQGVGPHKDSGILTLLWQDEVGGLQVFTEEKGWIDIPPVKDAYVINIGETLELVTNGYLQANIHQVVMRPENKHDRYSIPFFLGPNLDCHNLPLLPLPEELKQQARGPASDPLNPLFTDLGKNSMKGRLRSHLDTTKKFYSKSYARIIQSGTNLVI